MVEDLRGGGALPAAPQRLSAAGGSVSLFGIVVRKGGILLIDEVDMELNVGFIILESGGLLQAGSYAGDGSHRFKSRLRIQCAHAHPRFLGSYKRTLKTTSPEYPQPLLFAAFNKHGTLPRSPEMAHTA